jgi:hypothetical protein
MQLIYRTDIRTLREFEIFPSMQIHIKTYMATEAVTQNNNFVAWLVVGC